MRFRIFPILLIVGGSLLLLVQSGLISREALHHGFHIGGPVVMIGLGIAALFRRPGTCCKRHPTPPEHSTAG